jgi:hypothetical protein
VPDDNAMPQDLFHQLRLAILDRSDDDGLRTSTTIRSSLDLWEAFLRDRQQLLDHLITPHNDGPPYLEADRATSTDGTGNDTAATWRPSCMPTLSRCDDDTATGSHPSMPPSGRPSYATAAR